MLTAILAIAFLLAGDPTWMIAGANLTYLIGIGLPSVAVWLLRRHSAHLPRPYRAPRFMIGAGLVAAGVWGLATVFGFEQFGLPTVLFGLALRRIGHVCVGVVGGHIDRAVRPMIGMRERQAPPGGEVDSHHVGQALVGHQQHLAQQGHALRIADGKLAVVVGAVEEHLQRWGDVEMRQKVREAAIDDSAGNGR